MPSASYNRTTRVLRFDLTDAEVKIADIIVASKGLARIESVLADLFRNVQQSVRDQELARIREHIDILPDDKRQAILTIISTMV